MLWLPFLPIFLFSRCIPLDGQLYPASLAKTMGGQAGWVHERPEQVLPAPRISLLGRGSDAAVWIPAWTVALALAEGG